MGEAVAAGLVLDAVLATPAALAAARRDGVPWLAELPRPPLEIDADLLARLTDSDSPRGWIAIAHLTGRSVADLPATGATVFLDAVQDPGNVGAIARAAEAAAASALAFGIGCASPTHPRTLRGSAGSLLRLPWSERVAMPTLAERRPDARWLALVPRGGRSLWEVDLAGPLIVVVGAEGPGTSDAALERADLQVTIPMRGRVESLNAAVSAALVLFEIARRGG
ncbi:MAG: RNA methyltransferase [Acidobacteriota bacterium]